MTPAGGRSCVGRSRAYPAGIKCRGRRLRHATVSARGGIRTRIAPKGTARFKRADFASLSTRAPGTLASPRATGSGMPGARLPVAIRPRLRLETT